MRTTWKPLSNETKPLTFLLTLILSFTCLTSNSFGFSESDLQKTCAQFRQEELGHRITGLEYGAEQIPGYNVFTTAIKAGSKLAIWLSTRI